jgi:hypothetical protein
LLHTCHAPSQTRKVEKLLAALNLPQVGEIKLVDPDADDPDNDGALFTIELNTRYVNSAQAQWFVSALLDLAALLAS